ncbi:hypothetical protein IFM89_016727 [Coptis chinensis]|uniref:Uncharacterized protein n=1 Tax=Coptis chinensis TaxID=261450 RepID=A0A835M694_9MAGN|nr:hypothetical protein IFM89_016727 [Coptis chinensis]
MEKVLNPYDRQSMKMAILKHEETFREQVYELHRLYRVQKMLMKNMKSNKAYRREPEGWSPENKINRSETNSCIKNQEKIRRELDLECPAEGGDGVLEIEDENEIELTLGPARYRRINKDETPINADAGPSFSSSMQSSFTQRPRTDTHNRADRREELASVQQWGLIQVPNLHSNFQSAKKAFDVDENLKQERLNHPPWLLQVLSLKMT